MKAEEEKVQALEEAVAEANTQKEQADKALAIVFSLTQERQARLWKARSRLYGCRSLQLEPQLKALAEIQKKTSTGQVHFFC